MAHGDMTFFSRPSSSAVKISAPSTEEPSSPKFSASKSKDSVQRQCRNILIYGSCKFQDKGCIYYHPPHDGGSPAPPESPTPSAALPAQAVNAPIFVPKLPGNPSSPPLAPAAVQVQTSISSTSSSDNSSGTSAIPTSESEQYHSFESYHYGAQNNDYYEDDAAAATANPYELSPEVMAYNGGSGMDPFYSTPLEYNVPEPNFHLYTLPRPDAMKHKYFISDSVREELQKRSHAICAAPPPGLNLPDDVQGYHSLLPLEITAGERRKFGNWFSTVYRAVNSTDGNTYVLRRIESYRLAQQAAFTPIEAWSRLRHPNVVSVIEAFTTRAFNDTSLAVVYDDHPNAQTLYEAHMKPKAPHFQNGRMQLSRQDMRVPERTMWSYVIQIANAVRAVHEAGLAVRVIDPTKILLTGKNRVRLGSCGIVDVLTYDMNPDIAYLQQEDLAMFGAMVVSLCCGNLGAMSNFQKAIEHLGRHYSPDLKSVVLFLISKAGPHKSIGQLFDMIGSRLLTELDEAQNAVDRLEGELFTELENARLVRLLCKFGFINERPEYAHELRWSETGDRYIVKLFRDYVFHQVDEMGQPVVNLTHVLTCLNKLDAGTDERIMLVARDEQSCLVVSYKEIKACIDSAFSELTRS